MTDIVSAYSRSGPYCSLGIFRKHSRGSANLRDFSLSRLVAFHLAWFIPLKSAPSTLTFSKHRSSPRHIRIEQAAQRNPVDQLT